MRSYPLHDCQNPACDRLTTAVFCCGPCDLAYQHRHEVDRHTPSCDDRFAVRGPNSRVRG